MKKYWELTKPWNWLLFSFLVVGFWLLGCSKIFFFGFDVWKKPRRLIWGSIYSCTMDGFFRIFKKAVSEIICTRLYERQMLICLMFDNFVPQWWDEMVIKKDSKLFYVICRNKPILPKIYVILILLTFIYLVAFNLLVNNQLNSSLGLIIVTLVI